MSRGRCASWRRARDKTSALNLYERRRALRAVDPSTAARDARISLVLALVCALTGALMIGLAAYSMTPGACGRETGCLGGRDATPLTGIAVGSGLLGIAWAAWRKARSLRG